jgi:hypothetical protein
MWNACAPFHADFITPDGGRGRRGGAGADRLLPPARRGPRLGQQRRRHRHLPHAGPAGARRPVCRPGRMGPRAGRGGGLRTDAQAEVRYESPVRGIATSGWRGRSFSLGIADSVTVLAATAAEADAAATIIANAVDVAHAGIIVRRPACSLKDDSDLGDDSRHGRGAAAARGSGARRAGRRPGQGRGAATGRPDLVGHAGLPGAMGANPGGGTAIHPIRSPTWFSICLMKFSR